MRPAHSARGSRKSCARVRKGRPIESRIGEARVTLTAGQLVVVPAGRKHGFSNSGTSVLRIQSTLAAPVFEAAYDDARETPRRWLPEG